MNHPSPSAGPRLEIVMFSGDRIEFGRHELVRTLLHRYVIIHYVVVCFFLTLVNTRSGFPAMRMNERTVIVVFSVLAVVSLLILMSIALEQIAMRRGRLTVAASPFLMLAAVAGVLAGDATELALLEDGALRWARTAALGLFYYILVEAMAHIVVLVVVPRVLRDFRGQGPQATEPSVQPPPETIATVAQNEVQDHVEIGGRKIRFATLVRITAEGNYLRVVTSQERLFLPGPFSAAVQALPERVGVQLSRSEWVASAVVRGIWREGREMFVDLQDGSTLRVANSRQKVVTSLLDLPVQRGRPGSAGQGAESTRSIHTG